MILGIFPEGPIGFDGIDNTYSEGEGYYIDKISNNFDKIIVFSYWLRKDSPWYESLNKYTFKNKKIEFIELPLSKNKSIISKFFQILKCTFIIFKNLNKIDIAYLFFPSYPSVIACFASIFFKKNFFSYAASDWSKSESRQIFKWKNNIVFYFYYKLNLFFEKLIVKKSQFVLTTNKNCLKSYRGLNKNLFKTIPRINWDNIKIENIDRSKLNNPIKLLYVGGLYSRKGLYYLFKSLQIINKGNKKFYLDLVGTGEDKESYKKIVKELNISKYVFFHGHVKHGKKLMNFFKSSDIFIFPSLGEGFPRVLYESMSKGLPIITTNVGGIPNEIKHNKNGLLIEPSNSLQIVDSINRLISSKSIRNKLSKNSINYMKKLTKNIDVSQQIKKLIILHNDKEN